jgi:hypothetical protein
VLLADNQLLKVALPGGVVVARQRLGRPSPDATGSHVMALDSDGRMVHIVVSDGPARHSRVVAVDAATLRVRARHPLEAGSVYRSIAIGPRTGHLYLFGNQPSAAGSSVIVVRLEATTGKAVRRWSLRRTDKRDWRVYQGVVSADEQQVAISYHGPDTSGADVLNVETGRPIPCWRAPPPGSGCAATAHGRVDRYGERFLAATGSPTIEQITDSGRVIKRWETGLAGNHLMEFAVQESAQRLYALGSCGYVGGLSVVDLAAGRTNRLAPPIRRTPGSEKLGPEAVCGERIELLDGLLAIARTARPVPDPEASGAVLLIDARDGRLLRAVSVPSEPVDLLLAAGR